MALIHEEGMTAARINEELAKPFDESLHRTLKKGGQNFTYVPVSEYIARLNFVLGTENWEDDTVVAPDPNWSNWMVAHIKITANIFGKVTHKEGFGGQAIKVKRDSGEPVDIGDEYKGAKSDAFKKACAGFGMGLELSRDDEALAVEEEERQRIKDEKIPKATAEVLESIRTGLAELSPEDKATVKEWWTANNFPPVGSGRVTVGQGEVIVAKLAELKPKAPAKRAPKAAPKESVEASA